MARKKESTAVQQSYAVAKSNELIQQSRFQMSTKENKLMLYIISKIKPDEFGEDKTYTISAKEFCKVCNIDENSGTNIADVKAAIKDLADKSVWVKQADGKERVLRWLDRISYDPATLLFDVSFHRDMLPYLFRLRARYTVYSLDNILNFTTKYAIRLYELLKSYEYLREDIFFELDELKTRLDATKYNRFADFRRFVLEKAIDEINEYTDIVVEYKPEAIHGRSIDTVFFYVSSPQRIEAAVRRQKRRAALIGKKGGQR